MLAIKLLLFSLVLGVRGLPNLPNLPWKLPFTTSGPDILSADGTKVHLVGTNWPGHQEAMIPEGLQYSSIKDIVTKVRNLKLNVVRLTFAIEMIDNILDNGGDVTLQDTLTRALGATNGKNILNKILAKNPQFKATTKRLEVFDAVTNELAAQGIFVHLDNHISKAIWCCGGADGNGWFGDTNFDVTKWVRGWGYISAHAAKSWPSLSSFGLRNELRKPDGGRGEPYDWYTWYTHMTAAAAAAHNGAPNALIFFSGINYDTSIAVIPYGSQLTGTAGTSTAGKSALFNPNNFPYKNKIVLELHKYDFEKTQASCASFENSLYTVGYASINNGDAAVKYKFPMMLTEWGFAQDGTYWSSTTYNKCLIEFMAKWKPSGWIQWALGGSYMVQTRNGLSTQDADEPWGLLNHDWSGIRSQVTVDQSLTKMVQATLG